MKRQHQLLSLIQDYRSGEVSHTSFLKDLSVIMHEEDFDIMKEIAVAACEIIEKAIFKDISSRVKGSGE